MQAQKMCLQEDGDTKNCLQQELHRKQCLNVKILQPPVKKIMVLSLRPAGSHGEEETIFFSPLPLPLSFLYLFYFIFCSRLNFLDELTEKRLPRKISDACI